MAPNSFVKQYRELYGDGDADDNGDGDGNGDGGADGNEEVQATQ